jgi:hypothetical protein
VGTARQKKSVSEMEIFASVRTFDVKIFRLNADSYPDVLEPNLVGTYSPLAKAGGIIHPYLALWVASSVHAIGLCC